MFGENLAERVQLKAGMEAEVPPEEKNGETVSDTINSTEQINAAGSKNYFVNSLFSFTNRLRLSSMLGGADSVVILYRKWAVLIHRGLLFSIFQIFFLPFLIR